MDYVIHEFFRYLSDEMKLNLDSVYNLWEKFNSECINQIDKKDKLKFFDYQSNLDSIEETIELKTPPISPQPLRAPPSTPIISPQPLRAPLSNTSVSSQYSLNKKQKVSSSTSLRYQPPIRTSYDITSRKERAKYEPIYVMKFVFNSKDNIWKLDVHGITKDYNIVISDTTVNCSCIDFHMKAKQKNILCKHLYNLIYQLFNNTENVNTIQDLQTIYPIIHDELYKRLLKFQQRSESTSTSTSNMEKIVIHQDASCLICLVDLDQYDKNITSCTGACKQVLGHNTCLDVWFKNHNTCPLCRSTMKNSLTTSRTEPLYEII